MSAHVERLVVSVVLMLSLYGCSGLEGPVKIVLPPDFSEDKPAPAANEKRFQPTSEPASASLESAIELSEKYAQLSDKAAELKKRNDDITAANVELRQNLKDTQQSLSQAKKELNDANNLIMEMRIELNNWKSDVLGFRDEMKDADLAQLEALEKILGILGGEVLQKETPGRLQASASESPSDVNHP